MPDPKIDESRFPLVVVSFQGAPTDVELENALQKMTGHLQRGQRMVHLLDASGWGTPSGPHQQRLVRWFFDHVQQVKQWEAGCAVVFPNIFIRPIIQGFLASKPLPCPVKVFGNRAQAGAWAASVLPSHP